MNEFVLIGACVGTYVVFVSCTHSPQSRQVDPHILSFLSQALQPSQLASKNSLTESLGELLCTYDIVENESQAAGLCTRVWDRLQASTAADGAGKAKTADARKTKTAKTRAAAARSSSTSHGSSQSEVSLGWFCCCCWLCCFCFCCCD